MVKALAVGELPLCGGVTVRHHSGFIAVGGCSAASAAWTAGFRKIQTDSKAFKPIQTKKKKNIGRNRARGKHPKRSIFCQTLRSAALWSGLQVQDQDSLVPRQGLSKPVKACVVVWVAGNSDAEYLKSITCENPMVRAVKAGQTRSNRFKDGIKIRIMTKNWSGNGGLTRHCEPVNCRPPPWCACLRP